LQNAVSFNYYANNEIYDPRPDTIKINGNVTEIVDGEKNITVEKNKASLAQDTDGLTNKVEPVKDQVKEEVVANSGEDTQPLTDENNQPVETPVEKVKKYPGFDEKTGTYTTQNVQILKLGVFTNDESYNEYQKKFYSDKIVIPKGTKFYLGNASKKVGFEVFDSILGNKGINPNKYITKTKDMLPNNIPVALEIPLNKKISLADKIYYNDIQHSCAGGFDVGPKLGAKEGEPLKDGTTDSASYDNDALSKVLVDIFCRADGTVKTFKEIKQFDNTK
jgi:hypothetical protein